MPGISSIKVNGEDESHLLAIAGQQMQVEIMMTDDRELKQVMLKLQAISGLHHQNTNPTANFLKQLSFGALDTTMLQNISGKENTANFALQLPDSINGGWNMTIGVLDDNGNYFTKNYALHIHNENIPFAVINSIHPTPNDNSIVIIEHPDSLINFRLNGYMVDHTGFDSISVRLFSGSSTLWRKTWLLADGTWSFDLNNIVVNDTLNSGTYTFETNSTDMEGWTSICRGAIIVN